jgi:HK97 family phage major capsid protein
MSVLEDLYAELAAIMAEVPEGEELSDEQASRYLAVEQKIEARRRHEEIEKRHAAWTAPRPLHGTNGGGEDKEARAAQAANFTRWIRSGGADLEMESRTLSKGTDTAGGYLVPDEWRDKLIECIRSFGGFINEAEQITTSHGRTMNWPTVDDGTNEAEIVAESAAFDGGADPTFSEGNLGAYKYTTTGAGDLPLRVTVELLQDSMVDVDALLRRLMARRIHRKEAKHAVVGTGSGQPKGILNGTPDFSLTTTNLWDQTNNGWQDLVSIETLLDDEYLNNAKWLMNKTTYAQIRTLTDANGRPLIGLGDNGIDQGIGRQRQLLGYPVVIDNYAPNAANDTNFMAFGDFREAYLWRNVADVNVIQDPYARKSNGEVEYVAWHRAGGTVQNRCAYVIIGGVDAA